MTAQQKNLLDWVLKQGPLATVLILSIVFQYQYFTSQMDKMEVKYERKIEKLEFKIDQLENRILINKYSSK